MNYSIMTERETEIELGTSVGEGLSSFTAHDRLIDNGRNMPEKSYSKSSANVWLSQLKNLYTVAFIVMGIITAVCDFSGNMAAWIILFAVAVVNMVSGFLRDNPERQIALDFDKKRSDHVRIIRDGKESMTDPTLLVKGDIVVLNEGDFVPADLRILKCNDLKADESVFRRNMPRDKQSERLEDADPYEASNMLYCGSVIVHGSAIGAVVATGKDTALAKTRDSRSKKLDMHNKFAKSTKSEKMLVCAALLAATGVVCFVSIKEGDFALAMVRACTVALCLLPAPVYIIRLFAMKVGYMGAKRNGAEIFDQDFVYNTGMSEYLLFDKGGVVTSGKIEMEDRVVSSHDKLEMAVICSDCKYENGILTGNDIDKATAIALIEEGIDVKEILDNNEHILFMPFDEVRKLMAVLVKNKGGYRLIVKGSVEVIPTICSYLADGDETYEMSGEMMHRIETLSSSMAERGLKIRAFAYRDIDFIPENLENEIKKLTFVGALGYREVIVKNARDAVRSLEDVYVTPVMVTGDQTVTAAAIARQAGIIKKEIECISFREISDLDDEKFAETVSGYKVFTAATRSDRERLVRTLAKTGAVTAVAGEQLTEHSVAINANVTIGDDDDCDVKVENNHITSVSDVVYKARAARGNAAYISLLAIATGFAEALMLIYMILTGAENIPTPADMLWLNLFMVLVPCVCVALFASVHQKVKDLKLLATRCLLQGFIAALMCILTGAPITFFVFYTILEAGRICISFSNFSAGKKGAWGLIASAGILLVATLLTSGNVWLLSSEKLGVCVLCAVGAVVINAAISVLKLKGLKNSNV